VGGQKRLAEEFLITRTVTMLR